MLSEDFRCRLTSLIKEESAMIISTINRFKMVPWSATVYFLYSNGVFYFFSSSGSRHIIESDDKNEVAVSIHSQAKFLSDIRGVQMSGIIKEIRNIILLKKIISKYFLKFSFINVKEMIVPDNGECNVMKFLCYGKEKSIKLYGFKPYKVLYSDNYFGFGFRRETELV